jgi:PAS domain S-box-containing protein
MTEDPLPLRILDALPQAVSVVDGGSRLAYANAAFWRAAGVAAETCPVGTPLRELVRLLAYRGLYGAGDPEAQVEAVLRLDRSRPTRRQLGLADGSRTYETISVPLSDGGFVNVAHDITALLRAREDQAARAALLEATLARLRGGVARFDEELRLGLFNPAYEALIGLPGGSLRQGMTHRDVIALLEERGEFASTEEQEAVAGRLEADRHRASTRQRQRPTGQGLRFDTQPTDDGGFLLEVTDITALKRAEDEARRRAGLLDGVLAALPQGVCVFGPDRRVAMFNAAYARLMDGAGVRLGESLDEVVRRRQAQGEYDEETAAKVMARFAPGVSEVPTVRRARPNGTVLENEVARLPDGGIISVFTDVTALHRAEQAARERAELLRVVLEALPDGVVVYGPDRRCRVQNPAYRRILGEAAVQIGESLDELADRRVASGEITREMADELLRRHFGPESDIGRPMRRIRPNGTAVVTRAGRLPDGGHISVVTDVTALHRAEEELRRRNAILEASFSATRHGLSLFDAERRLLAANDRVCDLTGLPAEAVAPGRTFDEMVDAQVTRGILTTGQAAMAKTLDRSVPRRGTAFRPDGRIIEILSDPTPDGGFVITYTDVTALRSAEATARERAELLDAVLEELPDGVIVYGLDGRARLTNAAYRRMLGEAAARIGESFQELAERHVAMGEQSAEHAGALVRRHQGPREDVAAPIRRIRPNGTVVTTRAGRLPAGGHIAVLTDVTALHRAEEALRQRNAMLEASLAAMRHGIAIYGPDRLLLAANARTPDLSGVPAERLVTGRSLDELLDEQVTAGVITADLALAGKQADRSLPRRITRSQPDGRVVEVLSDPTPDGGFVVTYTDVTALHRAEAELRHRAAMQAAMLETIRHGIILYGPDRRLLATNEKTSELTGLPPDRLLPGRLMDELIDEQVQRGQIAPAAAAAMKAYDRSKPLRYSRTRPDGRVLDTVSEPTPDGGYVITYSDVTEERTIRAELERARAQAEAASEAKSRFLATMSHELRTPLNAVIGFSEAITLERDRARIAEYAGMINEAGRHLLQLVDDILDVARSQTGALTTAEEPILPGTVMEEAIVAIGPAASIAGLTLVTELSPALPRLRGDARRLRQVLDKLLSNAVKFTPAGGRVTLSAEAGADGLTIRVADTGIGIPAEERERMFEPFTQLDSSLARRFHGSGLGLHLARTLAAALGATLSLEDPEGPGLVAVLRFPPERLVPAAAPAAVLPA